MVSGFLMGLFYKYVAGSMVTDFIVPEAGKLTPYSALVIFAIATAVYFIARPRIHSCQMHIPNKFSSLVDVMSAIISYGSKQGWQALANDITSTH